MAIRSQKWHMEKRTRKSWKWPQRTKSWRKTATIRTADFRLRLTYHIELNLFLLLFPFGDSLRTEMRPTLFCPTHFTKGWIWKLFGNSRYFKTQQPVIFLGLPISRWHLEFSWNYNSQTTKINSPAGNCHLKHGQLRVQKFLEIWE